MRTAALWLAALAFGPATAADSAGKRQALTYSAASLVNAASNRPGPLAPNGFATLYGQGLAWTTRALQPSDLVSGRLPTLLPGTGVQVLVNYIPANIYFVSPTQINFLVPANLRPGGADVVVLRDGMAGPIVRTEIAAASPALFQADAQFAIAVRLNGALCTLDAPARPGEWITLFATALGLTSPETRYSEVPRSAAVLVEAAHFRVELDGEAVAPERLAYVGIAPGFAGLYQINVQLPERLSRAPGIRIGFEGRMSPGEVRLPAAPL
jgi:uncharacterized protein (TIGR03437 family)